MADAINFHQAYEIRLFMFQIRSQQTTEFTLLEYNSKLHVNLILGLISKARRTREILYSEVSIIKRFLGHPVIEAITLRMVVLLNTIASIALAKWALKTIPTKSNYTAKLQEI